jgi:AraC-like DNA-binding protein
VNEIESEPAAPQGTLYLWPDGILFIGSDMVNEAHRHFTASILVSLTAELRVYIDGAVEPRIVEGILVAPNTEQHMEAQTQRSLILQVDPETRHYARIAHHFAHGRRVSELDRDTIARVRRRVEAIEARGEFDPTMAWEAVMEELSSPDAVPREIDPRIREVLRILKQSSLEPPTAGELAKRVSLSEGRLIHLFTEQMGLPIRRYTLWLRLRDAFLSLASGLSITDAAHRAGFSDSAHMSRTFRGMFGIPPSFFKEGRGHVRTEFVARFTPDELAHPEDLERWTEIQQRGR